MQASLLLHNWQHTCIHILYLLEPTPSWEYIFSQMFMTKIWILQMCITRIHISANVHYENIHFHRCILLKCAFPQMCIINISTSANVYHKYMHFCKCILQEYGFLQMCITRMFISADVHFYGCAPTLSSLHEIFQDRI